jgi:glycosyltransferase involved in cell wall biosynthesis
MEKNMVSIITRTYNRANSIARAIHSILDQDHPDFEIVVVNDGSSDNTLEILARFQDPRIRVISHEKNMGMAAALLTGLQNIRGEWFTLLDSDDEMVANALSTMLAVPARVDSRIDAVTCNCLDSACGKFTGTGLDKDQYLDAQTIIQKCSGEFWGLTKRTLLSKINITKPEQYHATLFWHKINKYAVRYYIHQGLRIYHTENEDRYSNPDHELTALEIRHKYKRFIAILNDHDFLDDYERYGKKFYRDWHYTVAIFMLRYGDRKKTWHCIKQVAAMPNSKVKTAILLIAYVLGRRSFDLLKKIKRALFKNYRLK